MALNGMLNNVETPSRTSHGGGNGRSRYVHGKYCHVYKLTLLQAMFDTLEADIVVFQETKIQRKDLRDDMVLIPGWDCYFSLPRVKKGLLDLYL